MVLPQEQEHLPAVHSSVSINLEGDNDVFFRRHSFYYVFLEHSSSNVATFVACVPSSGNVATVVARVPSCDTVARVVVPPPAQTMSQKLLRVCPGL